LQNQLPTTEVGRRRRRRRMTGGEDDGERLRVEGLELRARDLATH